MKEIQQQMLVRALNILNALKVGYKVITDDAEYGELQVVPKKQKRTRVQRVAPGTYLNLFRDTLANMEIGDVEQFPLSLVNNIANSDPDAFRSALVAHACTLWGKGNYASTITEENVELMRMG